MQIASVKLENAKSYDNAVIEFTPGVNAIVGHNGAGKSTILEAIGLAVFDDLRYKQSEFVRSGTRSATITVTIQSNLDERFYDVVRKLGTTNSHVVLDPETGIRMCEGKADVLTFLREHLGVDSTTDLSAMFRDAVGVGQGAFTSAFLGTPAQRRAVFNPLLQVDEYRKAFEELRAPARLLDERRQQLAVTSADLRARLEALPKLEQAIATRQNELSDARQEQARSHTELDEAVTRKNVLEGVRAELVNLRNEQSRAVERQQLTARELVSAQQARADAVAAQELVEKHKRDHDRHVAARQREKQLDARVRERLRIENDRTQYDKVAAVAETRLKQLRKELAKTNEAIATMDRLKAAVHKQEDWDTQIVQARQDASRLRDVDDQIQRQEKQLAQLAATQSDLRKAKSASDELTAKVATLRDKMENAENEIDSLREEGARMKSVAETLKEQTSILQDVETAVCPVCEEPLNDDHRQSLLRRNEERLADLRAKYGEHLQRIKILQEEAKSTRKGTQEVERQIRELPRDSELARLETDKASLESSLESLRVRREELTGATDRLQTLTDQLAELGDPRSAYNVAHSQAAQKDDIVANIDEAAAELDGLHGQIETLMGELVQFKTLDQEMDECAAEIRTTEESYRVVLSNSRLAITVEERTAEVTRLDETTQTLSQEADSLAEQVQATEARFDEQAYAELAAREQTLRSILGALEARMEMLQQQIETDRSSIADLQAKQASLLETESATATIDAQAEMLDTIRSLLQQAGPYVTQVLIRQVSDNARQIFSDIMQDYSRHLAWTEDYGIVLEVDGHVREFSQLSGGEQMTAALAVRLALLRELSSIDVAFFDEPTANLDEARREALARQILEVKGFSQLFVISHDDTFEQATQNLIRVERLNGVSTISTE